MVRYSLTHVILDSDPARCTYPVIYPVFERQIANNSWQIALPSGVIGELMTFDRARERLTLLSADVSVLDRMRERFEQLNRGRAR